MHAHTVTRYKSNGAPAKQFQYIPVKNQLQTMMKDQSLAKRLAYRHTSDISFDNDVIRDVFDCSIYQDLLEKQVVVKGETKTTNISLTLVTSPLAYRLMA